MNLIKKFKELSKEEQYGYAIGIGLILFVIHNPNQWLIETKLLFLPSIGLMIIFFFASNYLLDKTITFDKKNKKLVFKKIDLGSKWVWIPLAIIVVSIVAQLDFANIIIALGFFVLYLVSREIGDKIFKPFAIAVIIAGISMIYGFIVTGGKSGGIISPGNYDMATGFLVFGFLISSLNKRWWLSAITIIGLFFTGADEAIFACVVIAVVVILRGDYNKKILLPIGALILLLAICTPLGITQTLYLPTVEKVAATKEVIEETPVAQALNKIVPDIITAKIESVKPSIEQYNNIEEETAYLDKATGYRLLGYWSLSDIKPIGYGFNMWQFYKGILHNVPLIIIEQIGIIGALAWCIVCIYCLIKTKWKYAWIGFLALGVFDHFTWTMAAPWFWVLAGVSSSSNINNDFIFKRE